MAANAEPTHAPDTEELVRHYTVVGGDSAWSIAEAVLTAAPNRGDVTESKILEYVTAIIGANEVHLASGNPDLIYPGEALVLP